MKGAAVIVAAGGGRRFGTSLPKQFQLLAGAPVVVRSCRAMVQAPGIDSVVLVLPPDAVDPAPPWLELIPGPVGAVAGGSTRTESVRRGVLAVDSKADVILVHDGVRPLVSPETVARVVEAAAEGPVVPVVPVADTVKRVDPEGRIVETVDRAALRLAQTPQGFPADLLRRVMLRAEEEDRRATDEASLCERFGHTVRTVPGDRENLKITRRGDLRLAELLVRSRTRPGSGSETGD